MDAEAIVHAVDDDEAVRGSLRFLLEAEGYVARTYPGAAGYGMTDLRMPGMGGLPLQTALASRGVPLAVVVLAERAT